MAISHCTDHDADDHAVPLIPQKYYKKSDY